MSANTPPLAGEVTRLIRAARAGDDLAVERLFPLVYQQLRAMARRRLAGEFAPATLDPTELVHEAWFKLAGNLPEAGDREHFLAIAARAMRQVLVDRARQRRAAKRGGGVPVITLSEAQGGLGALDPNEVLALDEALEGLEERQRRIVEYRFFGGLEEAEIAAILGVTTRTVQRDWAKARAWLYREMYGDPRSDGA